MLIDYPRQDILKAVNNFLGTKYKFVKCKDDGMNEYLVKFEAGDRISQYKFGVLYCKENQLEEYDMFGNGEFLHNNFIKLPLFIFFLSQNMDLKIFRSF